MALIRCPNCDTLHDLDDAFLATGRRKVRCASCRTVFEAEEPESDTSVIVAMPLPEPKAPRQENASAPAPVPQAPALDAFAAAEDEVAAAPDDAAPDIDGEANVSQDDLDALFGDAPVSAGMTEPAGEVSASGEDASGWGETAKPEGAPPADPDALEHAQDGAVAAGAASGANAEGEGASGERLAGERLAGERPAGERRARRGGGTMKKVPPPNARLAKTGMVAAMVMAAGIGTVSSLVLLREDAMRLFPSTSRFFDAVGLSTATRGLDIVDVQSQLLYEDGQETLEVSGRVVNNAKRSLKLPVLRLAIRGGAGSELYVWTANADVTELGPGEAVRFSRRLASPPADSQSVMVRFVAKDDIVAAIR